jgi:hypothetical protein
VVVGCGPGLGQGRPRGEITVEGDERLEDVAEDAARVLVVVRVRQQALGPLRIGDDDA